MVRTWDDRDVNNCLKPELCRSSNCLTSRTAEGHRSREVPAKRSAARSRPRGTYAAKLPGSCEVQRDYARQRRPRLAYPRGDYAASRSSPAAKLPSRRAPKPRSTSETKRGEEPCEVQRDYARRRRGHRSRQSAYRSDAQIQIRAVTREDFG
jgi:hypothetical protein